jgi:hypothetical protein
MGNEAKQFPDGTERLELKICAAVITACHILVHFSLGHAVKPATCRRYPLVAI